MNVYAFLYVVVSVLFVTTVYYYGEYYRTSVKIAALVCWIVAMLTAIQFYLDPNQVRMELDAENQDSGF